jgi:hypothetical protein
MMGERGCRRLTASASHVIRKLPFFGRQRNRGAEAGGETQKVLRFFGHSSSSFLD